MKEATAGPALSERFPPPPDSWQSSLRDSRRNFCARVGGLFTAVLLPGLAVPVFGDDKSAQAEKDDEEARLIISGGGPDVTGQIHSRFIELAGGKKGHVVVIPAYPEKDAKELCEEADYFGWKGKVGTLEILHAEKPDQANDPAFSASLEKEATGVWFTGGDQTRLRDKYRDTLVHERLKKFRKRAAVRI